jgi:hypothetical protein
MIRCVEGDSVSRWAGKRTPGAVDGPRRKAKFSRISGTVSFNKYVFIADSGNSSIRMINGAGVVTTLSSQNWNFGFGTVTPSIGMCSAHNGAYFSTIHGIKRVHPHEPEEIIPWPALSNSPGLAFDDHYNVFYGLDPREHRILQLNPAKRGKQKVALSDETRNGVSPSALFESLHCVHLTVNGTLWWANMHSRYLYHVDSISIPPIEAKNNQFSNFGELLNISFFSQLPCLPIRCSAPFYLNPDLLNHIYGLHIDVNLISKLEKLDFEDFIFLQFFGLLYGASDTKEDDPLVLARYLFLVSVIDLDEAEEIVEWIKCRFVNLLSSLELNNLLDILITISNSSYFTDTTLGLIIWVLKQKGADISTNLEGITIPDRLASIRTMWIGKSKIHLTTHSDNHISTHSAIRDHLRLLGSLLKFVPKGNEISSKKSKVAGNFTISITGHDEVLPVHDWVLHIVWPFFKHVMSSGLEETKSGELELPPDFPPSLLLVVLKFLYTDGSLIMPIRSISDCVFFVEQGGQFGFSDADGIPLPQLQSMHCHCFERAKRYLKNV